jgi:hypothetical protein
MRTIFSRLLVAVLALSSVPAFGGYIPLAHGGWGSTTTNGFTTSAGNGTAASLNTSGANIIWVSLTCQDGVSCPLTDSVGNTYTALASYGTGSGAGVQTLFYVYAPTTSATHTWTVSCSTCYPSLTVIAASGAASSPYDGTNPGTTAIATSSQPSVGGILPTQNNEIVITGLFISTGASSLSINSGFTVYSSDIVYFASSAHYGSAIAYLIQTMATTVTPVWSWSTLTSSASSVAAFKAAAVTPHKHHQVTGE